LARDIHDQVGTLLSVAKLKLSDLEEGIPIEDKEKLKSSISTLDMATHSLRSISHNLVPGTLSRLGLVLALEHFFNQLKQISTLKIDFAAHYFDERLSENMETNLYPIVLELTNNAIRHAQAKSLVIQLIRHPNKINITVEDDGIGFDYKSWEKSKPGIGLANIESRIETLKGSFDIDSIHGRGTIATVDVPI
jgi:signal transduction histidine kinase